MMRERPQESVDDKIVSTGQAQLVGEYIRHLRSKGGKPANPATNNRKGGSKT